MWCKRVWALPMTSKVNFTCTRMPHATHLVSWIAHQYASTNIIRVERSPPSLSHRPPESGSKTLDSGRESTIRRIWLPSRCDTGAPTMQVAVIVKRNVTTHSSSITELISCGKVHGTILAMCDIEVNERCQRSRIQISSVVGGWW